MFIGKCHPKKTYLGGSMGDMSRRRQARLKLERFRKKAHAWLMRGR